MKSSGSFFKFVTALHIVGILLLGCQMPKSSQLPSGQTGPPAVLTPEQMEEDVDFLVKTIKDCHPAPYAYVSRKDFKAALQKVRQTCRVGDMSNDNFYRHAAWLAGRMRNGHTRVRQPRITGKVFPLYWSLEEDKVILRAGNNLEKRYWGLQVVTIGGDPALEVMRYYAGLQPREGRDFDPDVGFLRDFLFFCLALDYGHEELVLELETGPGQVERTVVPAVDYEQIFSGGHESSSSPAPKAPIVYSYRSDCRTGIMKVRSFGDHGEFRTAIRDAFTDLKANNAENLIIDVRDCPGGDGRLSDALLCYLTNKEFTSCIKGKLKYSKLYQKQRGKDTFHVFKSFLCFFTDGALQFVIQPIKPGDNPLRFGGTVYVLINGRSRSTAADFAGVVRHYELGTLIGQETGDTMISYGDSLSYQLPNSRLTGSVSCKRYVMPGATAENALQGVQPHYVVRPLPDELWTHRDAVVEFALDFCALR